MVFEQYGCLCPNCCFCTSVTADACIQGGERVWQPKAMSSRCAFGRAKGGGKKLCRSRPKQQTHAKAASASVAVPAGRGKGLPPGTEIPKLTQPSKKEKETTKDSMVDTMRAAAATAEKRGVGSLSNARNNLYADDGLFHQLGLSERPAPCPNSTRSVSGTPHSRKLQNAVKARVAAEPKNAGRQSGGCNYRVGEIAGILLGHRNGLSDNMAIFDHDASAAQEVIHGCSNFLRTGLIQSS